MSVLKLKNKNVTNSKGGLIESDDSLTTKLNKISARNLRVNVEYKTAKESIEDGICVFISENGAVNASSALFDTECNGVAFKSVFVGEKLCYITSGKVTNQKYSFTAPFGRPVWLSISGVPTDQTPTSGYLRNIGISLTSDTFLLRIQPKIVTSTTQFRDKKFIPVTYRMYQKDGPLYDPTATDEEYPKELDMSDGTIFLSDRNLGASDDPVSVRFHQQTQPQSTWTINVGENLDVANVEVVASISGNITKVAPLTIRMVAGIMTLTFDQSYSGMVTYCVLN